MTGQSGSGPAGHLLRLGRSIFVLVAVHAAVLQQPGFYYLVDCIANALAFLEYLERYARIDRCPLCLSAILWLTGSK